MGLFDFLTRKKDGVNNIAAQRNKSNLGNVNIHTSFSMQDHSISDLELQRNQKVNEIRKLAKHSFPSKNGLRPHEIAMLASAHKYKESENTFPQYWHYEYGIDDPQQILNMLLDRGFVRIATAKESIEILKVPELKQILEEAGITPKGKKSDLIQKICECVSEEDLCRKIPIRKYVLTELGNEEIKENEYVTYFGKSTKYGLNVWDMNRMIQDYPKNLFRDRIWAHLNQQIWESANALQTDGNIYNFYCREISLRYEMCDFLIEENRNTSDALNFWLIAFYYDLMLKAVERFQMELHLEKFRDGHAMKRIKDPNTGESVLVKDDCKPQFKEGLGISYKINSFKTIQTVLDLSDDQIFQSLLKCLEKIDSIKYEMMRTIDIVKLELSNEEIATLIISEANGNEKSADKIYKNIERQIKSKAKK